MKDSTRDLIIILSILIVFGFACFMSGYYLSNDIRKSNIFNIDSSKVECSNKSLYNFVVCLNTNFSSWWYYNISNRDEKLTEEKLIEQGGVCSHASRWYISQANLQGFKASYIRLPVNDSSHAIALIWDNELTEYCILDQRNIVGCQKLKTSSSLSNDTKHLNTYNGSV